MIPILCWRRNHPVCRKRIPKSIQKLPNILKRTAESNRKRILTGTVSYGTWKPLMSSQTRANGWAAFRSRDLADSLDDCVIYNRRRSDMVNAIVRTFFDAYLPQLAGFRREKKSLFANFNEDSHEKAKNELD